MGRVFSQPETPNALTLEKGDYVITTYPYLGKGSFGIVFKASHKHDYSRQEVAAKEIDFSQLNADVKKALMKHAIDELSTMQNLEPHKNIVELFDHFSDAKSLWIFMELCDKGNLHMYLQQAGARVDLDTKLSLMQDCCAGLMSMHEQNVLHRDIKPQNILIKNVHGVDTAKISDFGLAKATEASVMYGEVTLHRTQASVAGTPTYMAPELFASQYQLSKGRSRHSKQTDIFSLGLVFDMMLKHGVTGREGT